MRRLTTFIAVSIAFLVGGSLTGCNVLHLNHFLLRRRMARSGIEQVKIPLPSGMMRCFIGGEGPPLLLLHGFALGAVENWSKQFPALSRDHHVVAPDLYWFGDSVPTRPIDSAKAQATAIVELLDSLHLPRVDVVGESFGGLIAIDLALMYPDRVDRVVVSDAAGMRPTREELDQIAKNFDGQSRIEELLMPSTLDNLKKLLERLVYRHKPPFPDWVLRQVIRELSLHRDEKKKLSESMLNEVFDEADLAKISARTLVLWGRNDPLLLPSMGERMAKAIPGAELYIFEHASHSAMLETPSHFNEVVAAFLRAPTRPVAKEADATITRSAPPGR